ncbi:molybdopterin oxidoreductase family protein [Bartonella sp. HY038]|uniref:molybdopterin oxidoreductase family protein n=1 Tax=Bartonella sp. HY038 TaxID=2759660 RepID=UPI0015FBF4FF|nr:molybdopterin oxidoreductase family protein [Bartonella sp. HY038]
MNLRIGHSACPHDCPSTCALDIELLADNRIGRVRGSKDNSYTAGVVCAKVARYAERVHHSERLLKPLKRIGKKGAGQWQAIGWDEALDSIAEKITEQVELLGSQTVWPYYFAGTMGLVQRDSINRLRFAGNFSKQFSTFCTNTAVTGYFAGAGRIAGVDPREMEKSDCIVIWGTNAAATQVNVMTHAVRARKERGAKIVAIDVFETTTVKQADIGLILKPGTDAALACAVMHVLFRDGYADYAYMKAYTDDPFGLAAHVINKDPLWAAKITGLSVAEIEEFAKLIGETKRCFFRLGFGFTRQRNGAVAMHAALSIPAVLGSWQYEGGGAFFSNSDIYVLNRDEITGKKLADPTIRSLDQSKIGRILCGDKDTLYGGPPVNVLFIQNTNPVNVAPEQRLIRQGFMRDDLFTVVHEQFMTDTAKLADIVLPATMFVEHDDIYCGGGHQHIILGPKLIEPPLGPKPNLFVINQLAQRLGFKGFDFDEKTLIDDLLVKSGFGGFEELKEKRWYDVQPSFDEAHFINGFGWDDKRFHFKVNWLDEHFPNRPPASMGYQGNWQEMPQFPDQWDNLERISEACPFRLATSPAHNFLNSTFAETPTSLQKERRPELYIHPDDAKALDIEDGDIVAIGNARGDVRLHAKIFAGVQRGVLISPGIFPNSAFIDGEGINTLTGAQSPAPNGGLAVHDISVWVKKCAN